MLTSQYLEQLLMLLGLPRNACLQLYDGAEWDQFHTLSFRMSEQCQKEVTTMLLLVSS